MPPEDTLKFNQCQKSQKTLFIIYADLVSLIGKLDGYKNNPENSYAKKVSEHVSSSFGISAISSFKVMENKHDV